VGFEWLSPLVPAAQTNQDLPLFCLFSSGRNQKDLIALPPQPVVFLSKNYPTNSNSWGASQPNISGIRPNNTLPFAATQDAVSINIFETKIAA
jgi:hypothetical protein